MKLKLSIDVTKIEKAWLFAGKKGTYLDVTIHLKDTPDQFGNDGFAVQQAPKAEYDAGKRGLILGNVKKLNTQEVAPASFGDNTKADDDLPF